LYEERQNCDKTEFSFFGAIDILFVAFFIWKENRKRDKRIIRYFINSLKFENLKNGYG
jgi:hypothetical protein